MSETTGLLPDTLNGIPMFASDYVEFAHPAVVQFPHRMIIVHSLLLWLFKMKAALLPASTEGSEYVADILAAVSTSTESEK